jgi:hypothetical protein
MNGKQVRNVCCNASQSLIFGVHQIPPANNFTLAGKICRHNQPHRQASLRKTAKSQNYSIPTTFVKRNLKLTAGREGLGEKEMKDRPTHLLTETESLSADTGGHSVPRPLSIERKAHLSSFVILTIFMPSMTTVWQESPVLC